MEGVVEKFLIVVLVYQKGGLGVSTVRWLCVSYSFLGGGLLVLRWLDCVFLRIAKSLQGGAPCFLLGEPGFFAVFPLAGNRTVHSDVHDDCSVIFTI